MGNLLFNPNPLDPAGHDEWMGLIESDKLLVNELHKLEHPLKKSSYELIFSDIFYYLTCKKKEYNNLAEYRRELEKQLVGSESTAS